MNRPIPPVRFPLGNIVSTPRALNLLNAHNLPPFHFLVLHQGGQWGDVPCEDVHANELSLISGAQLLSVYLVGEERLWIITEADRSITTLLLPDEY